MYKKKTETYKEYKQRIIDPVSDSFCAAKWLNATVWLNAGRTASCHHPTAHNIDIEAIKKNPSALHNTEFKKQVRKQMLEGTRPEECDYCWKIEDMGVDAISDRTFKTIIYDDASVKEISTRWDHDEKLQTLEIAFDRVCNFACMYCNASVSTTWAKDIKKNGPYENLHSKDTGDFKNNGDWAEPFSKDENPYIKAFWEWWPELSTSLKQLRITGGEPLMAAEVWKILDHLGPTNKIDLAINSNLGCKDELIDRLIEKSKSVSNLKIYTSAEAYGAQCDYIRDGMNYSKWFANCDKILRTSKIVGLSVMMTINALSLESMCSLLDDILVLKSRHNRIIPVSFSVNILRFPSFMSVLILPDEIRNKYKENLVEWINNNKSHPFLTKMELASLERLVEYLDLAAKPYGSANELKMLHQDFKNFFEQYDTRRDKSFNSTFSSELADWFNSIKKNAFIPIKQA